MVTYLALALAVLSLMMLWFRGKRVAKLAEEVSRLKSLEWSYRELRKDFEAKLKTTRQHLALVNDGKKLPEESIQSGKPPDEVRSDDEILEVIKSTIEKNRVAVFMKGTPEQPQCGFSASVVEILNEMKVPYAGVNAAATPKFRSVLSSFSNWPTLPQLYVDGKLVGGADIVREMKASGELQKTLDAAMR